MKTMIFLLHHLSSEANSSEVGEDGACRGIVIGRQLEAKTEWLKPLIRIVPQRSGDTEPITNTESAPTHPKEQPRNESKTQRSHPLR